MRDLLIGRTIVLAIMIATVALLALVTVFRERTGRKAVVRDEPERPTGRKAVVRDEPQTPTGRKAVVRDETTRRE